MILQAKGLILWWIRRDCKWIPSRSEIFDLIQIWAASVKLTMYQSWIYLQEHKSCLSSTDWILFVPWGTPGCGVHPMKLQWKIQFWPYHLPTKISFGGLIKIISLKNDFNCSLGEKRLFIASAVDVWCEPSRQINWIMLA